jgi:crossover junction endodeoxyribonuclease RuvC
MKVILGIDPGLTSTGYGVIEADGRSYTHIKHGVINTDPSDSRGERLLQLYRSIDGILDEYKPQEAGLESIFFAKNVKTALPVAEARGVILMCLARHNIPCREYTPLQIKQAVLGRGRAEKAQVQRAIQLIFGLQSLPQPDHASDAIAAALCHSNYSYGKVPDRRR